MLYTHGTNKENVYSQNNKLYFHDCSILNDKGTFSSNLKNIYMYHIIFTTYISFFIKSQLGFQRVCLLL